MLLKPQKFGPNPKRLPKGKSFMTVCIAALAADSKTIVCVADKALSYGDYFQWDSDSTKIIRLESRGMAILISGGEVGISKVLSALSAREEDLGESVSETTKICEMEYKKALDELVEAKFLAPRLITRAEYIHAISGPSINPYFKQIAEEIDKFDMDCTLLLCGFDKNREPFILDLSNPGIVSDMTRTGFQSIGSGWDKANSRLLFSEYKRSHSVEQVLYEVFDAKANAELEAHVGYEWDALVLIRPPISFCDIPKNIKELTEKVWAKANRSPFERYNRKEHLEPPPKDWRQRLKDLIELQVLAHLAKLEAEAGEKT